MQKQLFVLFNFNKGIFTHILLNAFDLTEKGYEVGVIFESEACRLISEYETNNNEKWERLKNKNLIAAVCEVCAKAMNSLDSAKRQNLPIDGSMYGHPALEKWIKDRYQIMLI